MDVTPLTPAFCIEQISQDNQTVNFYTSFKNYATLLVCFNFLGKAAHHLIYWGSTVTTSDRSSSRGAPRSLSPLNEFFLVLCRLRLGLLENDLAFRFGVSQSTVSRICITWINFLFVKFKDINIWPSREQINVFMPDTFQTMYPTTRCIVDATEIYIQMPTSPDTQQLTYSLYKSHNTLKALISITPSGAISFVSQLFGGSTSDRELTIRSGLLELLEPGDSVMADRGFTIADLLHDRGVTLNIPPWKSGPQLSEESLIETRRIANLRIHVERAIGRVKNYSILSDLPNTLYRKSRRPNVFLCVAC